MRFEIPDHGDLEFEEAELERLRMSMTFPTMTDLVNFIAEQYVLGPLTELINDHLQVAGALNLPSLNDITGAIVTDTQTNARVFTMENPDKTEWRVEDHWARFIQQVYGAAQVSDSSWAGVSEPDFAAVAWQLFELLQFLARRWLANQN